MLATFPFIFVGEAAKVLLNPLFAATPQIALNAIQPPYGLNILMPAYISYLEPAIASFIVFYIIKDKLISFSIFAKGIIFGAIIAAIHAGIYSIVQIVYSEGNLFYRIFYYGQFLWEYFALGMLTAYFCTLLTQ